MKANKETILKQINAKKLSKNKLAGIITNLANGVTKKDSVSSVAGPCIGHEGECGVWVGSSPDCTWIPC